MHATQHVVWALGRQQVVHSVCSVACQQKQCQHGFVCFAAESHVLNCSNPPSMCSSASHDLEAETLAFLLRQTQDAAIRSPAK